MIPPRTVPPPIQRPPVPIWAGWACQFNWSTLMEDVIHSVYVLRIFVYTIDEANKDTHAKWIRHCWYLWFVFCYHYIPSHHNHNIIPCRFVSHWYSHLLYLFYGDVILSTLQLICSECPSSQEDCRFKSLISSESSSWAPVPSEAINKEASDGWPRRASA